jgi:hypothetical protein
MALTAQWARSAGLIPQGPPGPVDTAQTHDRLTA